MVRGFQLTEMYAWPSLKHDMFLCQFAPGFAMPVDKNPCRTTSKRATHLRLVVEIMSRDHIKGKDDIV